MNSVVNMIKRNTNVLGEIHLRPDEASILLRYVEAAHRLLLNHLDNLEDMSGLTRELTKILIDLKTKEGNS